MTAAEAAGSVRGPVTTDATRRRDTARVLVLVIVEHRCAETHGSIHATGRSRLSEPPLQRLHVPRAVDVNAERW